jgi:hypothetical protein
VWRGYCLQKFIVERLSQLRTANYMSGLPKILCLACSAIALAGCQHPLAPAVARQQPTGLNEIFVYAGSTATDEQPVRSKAPAIAKPAGVVNAGTQASAAPQDKPLIASVEKKPASQVGQLADGLFAAFKTFTGH